MTEIGKKQRRFSLCVAHLILKAYELNYEVSFSEAYRPPEMVEIYAKQGRGNGKSLHALRLAIDLNIFKDGVYLDDTASYKVLGEFWESLSTGEITCAWGGRFKDGNHFSIEHVGLK